MNVKTKIIEEYILSITNNALKFIKGYFQIATVIRTKYLCKKGFIFKNKSTLNWQQGNLVIKFFV